MLSHGKRATYPSVKESLTAHKQGSPMKKRPHILLYAMLLLASSPLGAINKGDLIACLMGEQPPNVVCPER